MKFRLSGLYSETTCGTTTGRLAVYCLKARRTAKRSLVLEERLVTVERVRHLFEERSCVLGGAVVTASGGESALPTTDAAQRVSVWQGSSRETASAANNKEDGAVARGRLKGLEGGE